MKVAVIILFLIPLAFAADVKEVYSTWMKKHKRNYVSKKHAGKAFVTFTANHKTIEDNNDKVAKGADTFKMEHNCFSDVEPAKFAKALVDFASLEKPTSRSGSTEYRCDQNFRAGELDLRNPQIPVKDQGGCGSCWSFSAVGVLEQDSFKRLGYYLDFSEQNCVDCARQNGCGGGFMGECLEYYKNNGMSLEHNYPYISNNGGCQNRKKDMDKYYAPEWRTIPADERLMASIMYNTGRWVSACLDASSIQFYAAGEVIRANSCGPQPNHAIVLVGYGYDNRNRCDYWLIRNSWGPDWGDRGHFKLQRGVNACGIVNPYEGYRTHVIPKK